MATLIDTGILAGLADLFPFLLTLVLMYGVLSSIDMFKDKMQLKGVISFVLALMVFTSKTVMDTINLMAPWFILLFIASIFIMISYMIFGATGDDIAHVLKTDATVYNWIITLGLIIGLGSLAFVVSNNGGFGPRGSNNESSTVDVPVDGAPQEVGFWETLFHKKVLGAIFVLLVSMFTISRLSMSSI